MFNIVIFLIFIEISHAIRCYDGTISVADDRTRTGEKECGGVSNYCLQSINKKTNQIKRYCSSFTDEHNMEERCPMSGCHMQNKDEHFCCCQFDLCNEWKVDGNQLSNSEVVQQNSSLPNTRPVKTTLPTWTDRSFLTTTRGTFGSDWRDRLTTTQPSRRNSNTNNRMEIDIN